MHLVRCIDIVLEHDGYAVQGTSKMALPAFAVQLIGNCKCIRVYFKHSVDSGPLFIDPLYSVDVQFSD